jgi:hypothetical protein
VLIFNTLHVFDNCMPPQISQNIPTNGSDLKFCVWAPALLTPTFELSKADKKRLSPYDDDCQNCETGNDHMKAAWHSLPKHPEQRSTPENRAGKR